MGAGVSPHQPGQRLLDRLEERLWESARRYGTQRVAIQAGVLGRDPALLRSDAHGRGPALVAKLVQHALGRDRLERALLGLGRGQVAHGAQHVV